MFDKSLTRRNFLATAVTGTAAPAALKAQSRPVRLGLLGCGKITQRNVPLMKSRIEAGELKITACCDLYGKRLREMAELTGAESTTDYKKVLQRNDVDFVYIGTPDHWHAPMILDSIAAGKDVLVEKPMTLNTDEARAVYKAVKQSGCIFSTGSRSLRHGAYWVARDIVKTGILGHLLWCQTARTTNLPTSSAIVPSVVASGGGDTAGPDGTGDNHIVWDAYHGKGPVRDWDPDRFFNWRRFKDYSIGTSGDLLWYNISDILLAVGPLFPIRATGSGGTYLGETNELPNLFFSTIQYQNDFYIATMYSLLNDHGWSDIISGQEASLYFSGGHYGISGDGVILAPDRRFEKGFRQKCERLGLTGTWQPFKRDQWLGPVRHSYEVEAMHFEGFKRPASTIDEFIDCVRDRRKMVMDETFSYKVMQSLAMGMEALDNSQVEVFDSKSI
jgi:predicted dehydrogenase